jgi:hypothetical protein
MRSAWLWFGQQAAAISSVVTRRAWAMRADFVAVLVVLFVMILILLRCARGEPTRCRLSRRVRSFRTGETGRPKV